MIRYICAECQIELRPPVQLDEEQEHVSHGLCRSCMAKAMNQLGLSLSDYLNELRQPVLVIDKNARVITVNGPGQRALRKTLPEIAGYLGGEVFGCVHAEEPEGCGGTLHCLSCVIRNTVEDTYKTGHAHLNVPACQDLDTLSGPRLTRFVISTEKIADLVVLKIEDVTSE
jgi:hypothetical protein